MQQFQTCLISSMVISRTLTPEIWHLTSESYNFYLSETMDTTNEPPHDKTKKVTVRPVKTQLGLGIPPVWSESSLSAWRKLWSLATH